jgi:nicotinamide mononucleotide transporter
VDRHRRCIFYGIVFYNAKLYADAVLQVFFVVTGVIGWKMWNGDQDKRPQRYLSGAQFGACLVFALIVTGLYSIGLYHFTDSPAPFWDSSILVFSVVAQLLLMARFVHNWPLWLLVNIISVPLYWSRGLQLSSLLYAGYLIHACWATYHWLKLNKGSKGSYQAPLNQRTDFGERVSFTTK